MAVELIERSGLHQDRTAIVADEGAFTYRELRRRSACVASFVLDGREDLHEEPVAFLIPPSFAYVAVQWGIWRAGGIAVPLSVFHPGPELDHVLQDTGTALVIAHPEFAELLRPLAEKRGIRFALTDEAFESGNSDLPDVDSRRRAMIVYTSGTTGKPKGVVTTHENIEAQVACMIDAWEWSPDDRILEFLPLHHVHGIVNVLTCALWIGAQCHIMPRFHAEEVLRRVTRGDLTVFMAVPTIYVKLIEAWENEAPAQQARMSHAFSRMRLMVSGSAALPVSVLEEWRRISGHVLLERYGMTEIGMALTNPLHGVRLPGFVGKPFPGVEVRMVDEEGNPVLPGTPGELQVRGPGVFLEYWNRPEETRNEFRNGWFCTGDVAVVEDDAYRILGRKSVDIIKTGGYKVSALEIEGVLLTHPDIAECAVVGIEHPLWGERVSAAIVTARESSPAPDALMAWARERLAGYKVPRDFLILEALPKNPMGKVSKPVIARLFREGNR